MAISSQALQECTEGPTTRVDGPERTKEPHERAATKQCKVCLQTLPATKFYGGVRRTCKECIKARLRAKYKDPEYRANDNAKTAAYYAANRERVLQQKSGYGQLPQVAERDKARRRERYATDHAFMNKAKNRRDRYYFANTPRFRARDAKRRALQIKATPSWADADKIRAFYERADELTKLTGIRHEVDHIIPLNGRTVCGLHVESNLQVLDTKSNRAKSNKLVDDIV